MTTAPPLWYAFLLSVLIVQLLCRFLSVACNSLQRATSGSLPVADQHHPVLFTMQKEFKCPSGHALKLWSAQPYDSENCRCNECHCRIECSAGFLRCHSCSFDLCKGCYEVACERKYGRLMQALAKYDLTRPKVVSVRDAKHCKVPAIAGVLACICVW